MDLQNNIQPQVQDKRQLKIGEKVNLEEPNYKKPVVIGEKVDLTEKPLPETKKINIGEKVNLEEPDGPKAVNYNIQESNPITPQERKLRMEEKRKEYDTELENLRNEKKNLLSKLNEELTMASQSGSLAVDPSFQKIQDRISFIDQRMSEIQVNRKDIQRNLNPFTKEEEIELSNATRMSKDDNGFLTNQFLQTATKYGLGRVKDFQNMDWQRTFDEEQKLSVETAEQLKLPEAVFTYAGLRFGSTPNLEKREVQGIIGEFNKIKDGKEWNGGGLMMPIKRSDRVKLAIDMVKKYVDKNYGLLEPEQKKSKIFELSKVINLAMSFDPKTGEPTVEGIQSFAMEQMATIEKRRGELAFIRKDLRQLKSEGKLNGQQAYLDYIEDEYDTLTSLFQFNEKILAAPVMRSGVKDIIGAFSPEGAVGGKSMADLASLGVREVIRLMDVKGISKKLENDQMLTWGEQKLLETYSALMTEQRQGKEGILYQGLGGVVDMLPYFATFGISGKVAYQPVRKATQSMITKMTPVSLLKASSIKLGSAASKILATNEINLLKGAGNWASRTLGAVAQTAIVPQAALKYSNLEEIPEMQTEYSAGLGEFVSSLDKSTGEKSPVKALAKGFAMSLMDFGFEHSGDYLMKAVKLPMRMAAHALDRPLTKDILADNAIKLFGYKSWDEMNERFVKKGLGWHGFWNEYLEELGTTFGQAVVEGKNPFKDNFLEQQLVTAFTVAAAGTMQRGASAGVKWAVFGRIGDDMAYTRTNADGTKTKIVVPAQLHRELMNIMHDGSAIDGTAIDELIEKYSDPNSNIKLTEDLSKFIFDITMQEVQSKAQKLRVVETLKNQGFNVQQDIEERWDELTDEEIKANKKMISNEELAKINKKNEELAKKYPDLYRRGLLDMDPTGQVIEPNIDFLLSQQDSLVKELDDLRKGKKGTGEVSVENMARERELMTDIATLDKNLEVLSDKIGVPFNYRLPSKKAKLLHEELTEGKELEGTGSMVTPENMLLKLSDGRQITVYLGPRPGINETEDTYKERKSLAQRASSRKLPVKLKLVRKADWNPNDEAAEVVYNQYTGEQSRIGYGDRIEAIVDGKMIGAVQVHDYNERNIRSNMYRQAAIAARKGVNDIVNDLDLGSNLSQDQVNEKLKTRLENLIFDLSNNLDIEASETTKYLLDEISKSTDLTAKQKDQIYKVIEAGKTNIEAHVTSRKFALQGFKIKEIDLMLPEFESTESVSLTAANKVTDNLKTFFRLWKDIGNENDIAREAVEDEFHRLVQDPAVQLIKDEATYIEWLLSHRGTNKTRDAIIRYMTQQKTDGSLVIDFPRMLSAINFYSNARKIRQVAMILSGKRLKLEDLNPAQTYADYLAAFYSHVDSIIKGRPADNGQDRVLSLKEKLVQHHALSVKEFSKPMTDAEFIEARKIQFEKDLSLLEYITNINRETWRKYFYGKTNETFQLASENDRSKTEFGSWDNFMSKMSYRRGSDGRIYPIVHSNLILNLLLVSKEQDTDVFRQRIIDYFTKAKTSGDKTISFSNLYKLSTAEGELGSTGQDVKGDLFSSFQQYSDLYYTADHILESPANNPLVAYYKSIGKPMDLIILNGFHNRDLNKYKDGTPNTSMSMEDIWVSLINTFVSGKETYLQNVGQFADKPYIYLATVPKVFNPSAEQIALADQIIEGQFAETVQYFYDNLFRNNVTLFSELAMEYPSMFDPKTRYIDNENERVRKMITAFVYNYVINQRDINQIFFGVQDKQSYPKGVVDMFKRAGSTNSPGYRLHQNVIGGVGKTFRFAVINDKRINDRLGAFLTKNGMDGCVFYLDKTGSQIQTSMGSLYSKDDKYPSLSTTKALMSWKNRISNKRGLVKGNWYNIETLASEINGATYQAILQLMKENGIEVLAVGTGSSVKIIDDVQEIKMFDENGNILQGISVDQNLNVKDKFWDDVYIQQDLRHQLEPKVSKMPIQNYTTMLSLDNGFRIAGIVNRLQTLGLERLWKEFKSKVSDEAKVDWLKENINEYSQPDLFMLINSGLTVDDPIYRNMMRTIISSSINSKSLELPINRIVTIEIPDLDGLLAPLTKVKSTDGTERSMLAECAASYDGRVEDRKFEGDVSGALKYVSEHKDKYADLFDEHGNLMEWEITGRNGVIPGEVIFLTRVPNSGFSTFDVARLKFKFKKGNFAMINREGQVASSSDFDGDQRYIQVPFKVKDRILYGNNQKGLVNQMMRLVVQDYTNPKFYDRIRYMIDTNAYDTIVKKLAEKKYARENPLAFEHSRLNNKVGLDMKGGMTNLLTVYSLISRYDIPFRKGRKLEHGETYYWLTGIAKDSYGAIRAHMENFLTMFFDNQKDPKLERMGFNEITGNMFILMLIGNKYNGSDATTQEGARKFHNFDQHYKHILNVVEKQVEYFNGPVVRRFVEEMRREKGGMHAKDVKKVFRQLVNEAKRGANFKESDVSQLRTLYYNSMELSQIKNLHGLTQEAPSTYAEFIMAKRLVNKAKGNSMEQFKLFDLKALTVMTTNGVSFVPEFAIIDDILDFSSKIIFDDVVPNTRLGKQILDYIFPKLSAAQYEKQLSTLEEGEKVIPKKNFTEDELNAIFSAMDNVFNIRAIGLRQSFIRTSVMLENRYNELKTSAEYRGNLFLQYVELTDDEGNPKPTDQSQVRSEKTYEFKIKQEFRKAKIHDNTLGKIRDDFEKLPIDVKDLFATYQIQKYGSSVSTANGGFYSLFGNQYRIELSRRARAEMDRWYFDEIKPLEKLAIADWVIRSAKTFEIRNLQEFTDREDRMVDFSTDPTIKTPIHRDVLEAVESIDDINDPAIKRYIPSFTAGIKEWATTWRPGVDINDPNFYSLALRPAILTHMEGRRKLAETSFPTPSELTNEEIKDLQLEESEVDRLMMTYDEGLNKFIYDHFKEKYPDVWFMQSEEAFIEYVRRNRTRMTPINLNTVGHAFANAVYIDPKARIQEAIFHEYSHVYWDALPDDHKVKTKLRELYSKAYPELKGKQLEEKIIRHIGRVGTEKAESFMKGSIVNKFMNLLQEFWTAVKIMLGKYSEEDLVNSMVSAIWSRKGKISPSSNLGTKQVNDLILFDENTSNIIRDDINYQCSIGNMRCAGITTVLDRFKYDKFNYDQSISDKIESFKKFWKEARGVEATDAEVDEYHSYIAMKWSESTNAGTLVHLVAKEVFSNEAVDYTDANIEFEPGIHSELVESLQLLKIEILKRHPNAKFHTEVPVVSLKHKVFGYADLIVDIGDNKLIVFDFKTTEKEFKNPDGTLADSYKREYGFMLPPLTSKKQSKEVNHRLQLNLYANILEEQDNAINPVEKNEVVEMYVVPIITKVESKKVAKAHMSHNVIDPNTNVINIWGNLVKHASTKDPESKADLAEDIMNHYNNSQIDFNQQYQDLEKILTKANLPWPVKNRLLEAYHYLSANSYQKLSEINRQGIASLRGTVGYRGMIQLLLMKDFTFAEMANIPMEALFHLAFDNVTKEDWMNPVLRENNYGPQPVDSNRRPVLNPNWIEQGNGYYHVKDKDVDIYLHDAGVEDVKEGDEILIVTEMNTDGKKWKLFDTYKITRVNAKTRSIKIINQATGIESSMSDLYKNEGLYLIDKQRDPNRHLQENNFVSKYIYTNEPIMQDHWKDTETREKFGQSAEGEKAWQHHVIAKKKIYSFFRRYKTKEEFNALLDNKIQLQQEYAELLKVAGEKDTLLLSLLQLLEAELVNTMMAQQIRIENEKGPSANMPMTLDIYKIITNAHDSAFRDIKGYNYYWNPTRKLRAEATALNWVTRGIDYNLLSITKENYDMNAKVGKYFNKLNYKRLINSKRCWKKPSDPDLTEEEAMFLKIIYDIHYSRDPIFIQHGLDHINEGYNFDEHGYPVRIPVTELHATKMEVISKVGRRWGSVVYDIMYDTSFDHIKFKINGKVVTLGDIKNQFAFDNATPEELQEWLGGRDVRVAGVTVFQNFWFRDTPALRNKIGTEGTLYDYYKKARQIYQEGNDLNSKASALGKSAEPMQSTESQFKTNHLMEAEIKVLESMIFSYYMKEMMGPIEYALTNYKSNTNAYKYLKEYTDLIVYRKSETLGNEWVHLADIMQQYTSLRFIGYSLKTQMFNFGVGQAQNLVREGTAYGRGLMKLINPVNIYKAINILRSYGLASIIDETQFDTEAKRAGIDFKWGDRSLNLSWEAFKSAGYFPMALVERFNQIPIFVGLMTEEEWNSYNNDGTLIKGKPGLSSWRRMMISERVKDVHGDYTPQNAAPFWNTALGNSIAQYSKWAPALIDSIYMPHSFDRNYMMRSGMFQSTTLLLGFVGISSFNSISEKKRYAFLRKALLRWPDRNKIQQYNQWVDKTFTDKAENAKMRINAKDISNSLKNKELDYVKNTLEYLQLLTVAGNEGRIRYKDFSDRDKRNLYSVLVRMLMFALINIYLNERKKKSAIEKSFDTDWDKFWEMYLQRFSQDMFVFLGQAKTQTGMEYGGWTLQKLNKPIVSVDMLASAITAVASGIPTMVDVVKHSVVNHELRKEGYSDLVLKQPLRPDVKIYEKDTREALEGDARWWHDLLKAAPFANASSFILSIRVNKFHDQQYKNYIDKMDLPPEAAEELKRRVGTLSVDEIKQWNHYYEAKVKLIKAFAIAKAFDEHPEKAFVYRDIQQGNKLLEKFSNEIDNAIGGLTMHKDDLINTDVIESMTETVKEFNELISHGKNQSDAEVMRRFKHAVEIINSDPAFLDISDEERKEIDEIIKNMTIEKTEEQKQLGPGSLKTNKK